MNATKNLRKKGKGTKNVVMTRERQNSFFLCLNYSICADLSHSLPQLDIVYKHSKCSLYKRRCREWVKRGRNTQRVTLLQGILPIIIYKSSIFVFYATLERTKESVCFPHLKRKKKKRASYRL